jgi:uncharacterized protein YjbI with pentapeptide repeats
VSPTARARPPADLAAPGDLTEITGSGLAGTRVRDGRARDCVFAGADLANVHAPQASVQRSALRDARLTGATLTGASVRDVTLTGCRADLVTLAGARLERVLFADCDLRETGFDEAHLRDVRFERCRLDGASFHRAILQRVELAGCELRGVRAVTDLRGATMPWEDIVANAGALAAAAGIGLLDEHEGDEFGGPRRS